MPELSYREAVRDAMSTAMRRDEDVFIMGEDIAEMGGSMGVTQGMLEEFGPERVRNTPISEMAIVGAGIGAAIAGMRPIVEIMYQDFTTLAMEQIVSQAAKHRYMSGGQIKVPITIRTQGGAGWSPGAQHAQQLEAWFVHVPGLKVVFPSTPEDVRGLLWSSIYEDNPIVFFTEAMRASSSSGCSVRGSKTSTEIPCSAACSAALSDSCTSRPVATTVTSSPSRWIRALPISSGSISSGTSPLMPYSVRCSKKTIGLSS